MGIKINQEKQIIIDKLESLKNRLVEAEKEFNVNLLELITKVNQASENIKNEVFSIAFFGAFSDGKSTILSVLLNKLDIDISPEPTTDKIQIYNFDDYQIIDTPGLFSENLIHDEITKKYISNANIIIYTVDPVNPLKDSHIPTIKWILSELKKHDSTIFVINKMDEIADLEDDNDFVINAKIKKEVVSEILKEEIGVEEHNKIVSVAADPFEMGLEHWSKDDNYKKLSRIYNLENVISEFKSKYKNELLIKAGISVIRDTSNHFLSELNEIKKALSNEADLLKNQIEEFNNRIKVLEKDINRSYINLKEDFISLREDILIDIDNINDINELAEVLQRRIGENGYIVQEKIDLIIKRHTDSIFSESKEMFKSLEESLVYHSRIQDELLGKLSETGKSFIKGLLGAPTREIADAIIKTRDFLKIPFQFKPWGAIKFAKFLKAMPVVMEAFQLVAGMWSKYKLDKKRTEVKREIETAFKGLIQNLTLEEYIKTYFPFISETQNILLALQKREIEIQNTITKINKISSEINIKAFG